MFSHVAVDKMDRACEAPWGMLTKGLPTRMALLALRSNAIKNGRAKEMAGMTVDNHENIPRAAIARRGTICMHGGT